MQNTERVAKTFEATADKLYDTPSSIRRNNLIFNLKLRADQVRAGQLELDEATKMLKPTTKEV